jgi:hypothetical protein
MRHNYTPEQIQFLRDNIAGHSCVKLLELFNLKFNLSVTTDQMGSVLRYYNLRERRTHHRYTPEEIQFIENNISGHSYAELVHMFNDKFNCSTNICRMRNFLEYHNLRNNHYFNYRRKPAGSESIDPDGYTQVKIGNSSVWQKKQAIIWEKANGPIPKGHVVIFADGNKSNFALDNLLLVSLGELVTMNRKRLIFKDKDLTKTGHALAALVIAICDREREIGLRPAKKAKKGERRMSETAKQEAGRTALAAYNLILQEKKALYGNLLSLIGYRLDEDEAGDETVTAWLGAGVSLSTKPEPPPRKEAAEPAARRPPLLRYPPGKGPMDLGVHGGAR